MAKHTAGRRKRSDVRMARKGSGGSEPREAISSARTQSWNPKDNGAENSPFSFCLLTFRLFPGFLASLFVMFKRSVQTAYHFRRCFEERLRFGFIHFVNVVAQMFDHLPEFFPNIRGMRPRIF